MTNRELEAELLKLPQDERARLAELLIASLDEEEFAKAWADVAERRYEELRSGTVQGIPADEVFARLRTAVAAPVYQAKSEEKP